METQTGGKIVNEWEALIQRRVMLREKVSKMNYEVEKIDKRLAFLGRQQSLSILVNFRSRI
jgi:hypothetical protein